jgi:replicative DNA helicase
MRNLQSLALATKSVGIILSQVKKGIEFRRSKKPTVSDIEWSGLIKQLSSYIFFSYYPGKYYGFDVLKEDEYFLLAEKTRFAENFVYPMIVDQDLGTFKEIESPDERMQRVNKLRQVVD